MSKTRRTIFDVIKDCALRQQDPDLAWDTAVVTEIAPQMKVCKHDVALPIVYVEDAAYFIPNLILCTGYAHRFIMELKEDE